MSWFGPRPKLRLRWRLGVLKGWICLPLWRAQSLLGRTRIRVGRGFSLQGRLILRGPGTVILGDDVTVDALTTFYTHSKQAVIQVGDRSYVNGARLGCVSRIEIGQDGILGDCRIMDTDFHPVHKGRRTSSDAGGIASVKVGKNVWLGAGSAILKGVKIGDHSVVAFGAVVVKDIPESRIYGGNPARDLGPVPDCPAGL